MNRNEAIDVLETIGTIYPRSNVSEAKAKLLLPRLLPMDYSLVMEKLSEHVAKSPYPPTLAEIAAYPPQENEHLRMISKWQKEAAQVPDTVKERFHKQMINLIKEKSDDSNNES